jgi:hypothetical protein
MKSAVSLPDEVLHVAERQARQTKKSVDPFVAAAARQILKKSEW